jgi:hypothetical protein
MEADAMNSQSELLARIAMLEVALAALARRVDQLDRELEHAKASYEEQPA